MLTGAVPDVDQPRTGTDPSHTISAPRFCGNKTTLTTAQRLAADLSVIFQTATVILDTVKIADHDTPAFDLSTASTVLVSL